MSRPAVDIGELRVALRGLSRGILLAAARRVASAEQQATLRRLPARERRR